MYATSVDFGNVKLPVETACKRNDIVNVETATDIPPLSCKLALPLKVFCETVGETEQRERREGCYFCTPTHSCSSQMSTVCMSFEHATTVKIETWKR